MQVYLQFACKSRSGNRIGLAGDLMGEKERLSANAINKERCRNGTDFLENLIFCDGRAVVVKGKFNIASREANKLIFTTIRPYNEKIKTLPKICDELVFPVDTLWKVRLLEQAIHSC